MITEFRIDKYKLLFDLQPEQFTSDHNLLWYHQQKQAPEPEVVHVMLRALKAGDCAVDAGANIGFFTVLMSKIVGPSGKVLAIEPDRRNLDKLRKNLDINSCANVELHPYAMARERGTSFLRQSSDNGQTSLFGDGEEGEKAYLNTLDNALTFAPGYPTLLKMDIEGSEVAALQGCTYDFPYIVTEVNDGALKRAGASAEALFTILRERGYSRHLLHADGSMPSLLYSAQSVVLRKENANMLFTRPGLVGNKLWPVVEI